MRTGKLRVLVIDDSAVVRDALASLINSHDQMEVMGTAIDPFEAAEKIKHELPDVITLDIEMPRMDGITFLRRLMAQRPLPVVICSSLVSEGSMALMNALDAGAVEIVQKPSMGTKQFIEESRIMIQDKILAASAAKLQRRGGTRRTGAGPAAANTPRPATPRTSVRPSALPMSGIGSRLIAIGASTGGTAALKQLLSAMPPNSPPIVIVQHMPSYFTAAFAKTLNETCAITVREGTNGAVIGPGEALIAPGAHHMALTRTGARYGVQVVDGPLVSRHRPSVDVLFKSVAKFAGKNGVGVIMTGMGRDGADGLKALRDAGGRTIGQSEKSCVVYGMPRVAKSIGAVEDEVDLDDIPGAIFKLLQAKAA